MLRKSVLFYAIVICIYLSQSAFASTPDPERRAFVVDDLLKIEGIGAVHFTPNRKSVVFEYFPAYGERGDYGVERGGEILKRGLAGEQQATPLFEHQVGKKYWMGEVSPDGRRLIVLIASRSQTQIGIYDFEANQLTYLDEAPQFNERFELNSPIWINNHEVVVSARAEDWSQYGVRKRPHVADQAAALRERAFAGTDSAVSVSTDPVDHWYDGDLIRYNVTTQDKSVVARGRFGSFALSPDGKKLAALRLGQRRLHFPVDRVTDYFRFDTQLFVFDLEDKSAQSYLPNTHVHMGSLRWSHSGSKLSYFAWDISKAMGEGSHFLMDGGSIVPIQVDGFEPSRTNLVPSGVLREPVVAEWVQERLVVHGTLSAPIGRNGIGVASKEDAITRGQSKWHAIAEDGVSVEDLVNAGAHSRNVYRLLDGRILLFTDEGFFIVSDSEAPVALEFPNYGTVQILNGRRGDEIEGTIAFTASAEGIHKFGFLDLTRFDTVAPSADVASRVLAWAPDTRHIVARSDTEDGSKLYLQTPTEDPLEIFSVNEYLSEIQHPRWETIDYTGADGAETFSCILLPYNYDPQESYPTIVDVYPGTGKGCRIGTIDLSRSFGAKGPLNHRNEVLSANGYLVVRPSNTFELNQSDGILYGGLKAQVDAVLDALVDEGMTDPERIGLWGFSNGSLASLWLASVSNRYKAVVPMFGASSPHIEYYGGGSSSAFQSYLGRPIVHLVNYESERGGMPLSMGTSAIDDPLAYIKASPLDRAKYICSPIMMVHSDFDSFSSYHYEALFSAMYRIGNRAELVRYYGEGHGIRSPGNIRDFYKRVLAFFDGHVATGSPLERC